MPLNPAAAIVRQLGGIRPTARAVGISPSAVLRWTRPRSQKGTAGTIPQKHWPTLIAFGKSHGLRITIQQLSGL
ncbi:MAG: carph-isopro domain-containing protein [Schleiferiaceae bacterium]